MLVSSGILIVRAHEGRGGFQGVEREYSGIKVYLKWYRIIGQYSLNGHGR